MRFEAPHPFIVSSLYSPRLAHVNIGPSAGTGHLNHSAEYVAGSSQYIEHFAERNTVQERSRLGNKPTFGGWEKDLAAACGRSRLLEAGKAVTETYQGKLIHT